MEKTERQISRVSGILSGCRFNEVTKMGLFDVFSKGGKYFGKAIEPKCEYCEFGKRSSDGDKVLCTKKGMVDAGYHCPKFLYSPLKRIPVKQMQRVGWLEGDYDEKEDKEAEKKPEDTAKPAAQAVQAAAPAPAGKPAAPVGGNDLAALAAMAEKAGDYAPDQAAKTANDTMNTLSSM